MSDDITLNASLREVTGKKVKQLRTEGLTPIVLYGPGFEPMSLQTETRHLRHVLDRAGTTHKILINIDGESEPRKAIARSMQIHPTRLTPIHADLLQVREDVSVETTVPLEIVGEPPKILLLGETSLVQLVETLRVRARPDILPTVLEIDCSSFWRIGQVYRVRDIKVEEGVVILTDPNRAIARLSARRRRMAAELAELEGEDAAAAAVVSAAGRVGLVGEDDDEGEGVESEGGEE